MHRDILVPEGTSYLCSYKTLTTFLVRKQHPREVGRDFAELALAGVRHESRAGGGTRCAFPKIPPADCFISQLVTVRTDYRRLFGPITGDCLSIHRPIHDQYTTDTYLVPNRRSTRSTCWAPTEVRFWKPSFRGCGTSRGGWVKKRESWVCPPP